MLKQALPEARRLTRDKSGILMFCDSVGSSQQPVIASVSRANASQDPIVSSSPSDQVALIQIFETEDLRVFFSGSVSTTDIRSTKKELERIFAPVCAIASERAEIRSCAARQGIDMDILGLDPTFLRFEQKLKRLGSAEFPVLLTGERGAGKEYAAFAIHYYSRRRGSFLPVNCGAITPELCGSELFGYKRGAYTGAFEDRLGKFAAAQGGTIFLDEITELPEAARPALLRVLESGELQRVGSDSPSRVDVRIVAATNKDLEKLVLENKFPADLFDRLSVLQLRVPPLRERPVDIPLLADYFARRYCSADKVVCAKCLESMTAPPCIDQEYASAITHYPWPGNIRQLRNALIRSLLIETERLPFDTVRIQEGIPCYSTVAQEVTLELVVTHHIKGVLERTHWNKSAAARILGIPLSTLVAKMKRLGIHRKPNETGSTDPC